MAWVVIDDDSDDSDPFFFSSSSSTIIIILWQTVLSKDGCHNVSHSTCPSDNVTLTLFPLNGGVYVLSL